MTMDSLGQQVKIGDLVAYNLSGNMAIGRILEFSPNRPRAFALLQQNFKIELLAGPGKKWMNKDKEGRHISKVKYAEGILKITSRADFEERYGHDRSGEGR